MKGTRAIFGFHAILARLRSDPASLQEILLDEERKDGRAKDLVNTAEKAGAKLMRVSRQRLDGFYGGGRHQGVVAMVEESGEREGLEDLLDGLKVPPLLLVLDGVTDPRRFPLQGGGELVVDAHRVRVAGDAAAHGIASDPLRQRS